MDFHVFNNPVKFIRKLEFDADVTALIHINHINQFNQIFARQLVNVYMFSESRSDMDFRNQPRFQILIVPFSDCPEPVGFLLFAVRNPRSYAGNRCA